MKVLGTPRPLSLLLNTKSPPFSLLHSIFSSTKHSHKLSKSMAACIVTSRTTNPSQLSQRPNMSQPDENHFEYENFCKPTFLNRVLSTKTVPTRKFVGFSFEEEEEKVGSLWLKMKEEARLDVEQEPILSSYYHRSILSQDSLERALANHLSIKLINSTLPTTTLFDIFMAALVEDQGIIKAVKEDLKAVIERDPACISYVHCLLNYKGFLACQSHRVAHNFWSQGRKTLALLIQNRVSEVFAMDIHPGAKIGSGVLFDHATGVVVGETAVIGNNVSILHNVTLGGTGKVCGDRHPKIGDGVLIGAGTCILGNIKICDGAKIGAGSVVLKEVPLSTTAVGNPARLIGGKENPIKLDKIPSFTMDHTSDIKEWSDYVIQRCKQHEAFLSILHNVEAGATFSITDLFPSVKFLPVIGGMRAKFERIHHDLDEMLESIIEEHRASNANANVLLKLQDHGGLEFHSTTDNIKAVILDMLLAGTETSSTTAEWGNAGNDEKSKNLGKSTRRGEASL